MPVVTKGQRGTALQASVETYRKFIRWGYYDEAIKYLRHRDGSSGSVDLGRVARHRVTSYEISDQILTDDGKEARVVAVIEYYEIDTGVIHSLRDEQLWWFEDEGKRWYLDSSLPAFGVEEASK